MLSIFTNLKFNNPKYSAESNYFQTDPSNLKFIETYHLHDVRWLVLASTGSLFTEGKFGASGPVQAGEPGASQTLTNSIQTGFQTDTKKLDITWHMFHLEKVLEKVKMLSFWCRSFLEFTIQSLHLKVQRNWCKQKSLLSSFWSTSRFPHHLKQPSHWKSAQNPLF